MLIFKGSGRKRPANGIKVLKATRLFFVKFAVAIIALQLPILNVAMAQTPILPVESEITTNPGGRAESGRQKAEFYDTSCSTGDSGSKKSGGGSIDKVYILGDSITVGAKDEYEAKLKEAGAKEVKVSASGGGNIKAPGSNGTKMSGLDAIKADADFIKGATAVVIAHGTNQMHHDGPGGNYVERQKGTIKEAIDAVKATGTSAKISWVDIAITTRAPSNVTVYAGPINQAIYGATSEGYSIIPWSKVVDPSYNAAEAASPLKHNPELVLNDGIHLTGDGTKKLVETVIDGIKNGGVSSGSSSGSSGGSTQGLAGEEGTEGPMAKGGSNKKMQIVVHTTEGDTAESAISTLKSRRLSYHILIEKDGKEIRLVEDEAQAFGAKSANEKSLHVSLVGYAKDGSHFDPKSPQLQTLSKRIAHWANKYDIPIEKVEGKGVLNSGDARGVTGHSDIARADPVAYAGGGKSDPGEKFPWDEVLKNARGGSDGSKQNSNCCDNVDSGKTGSGVDGGGCGDKGYAEGADNTANKQQIWNFLINSGLKEEAAAGIMGNMEQESNFMPDADNGASYGSQFGSSAAGVGCVGIVQWCFGRIDNLVNFAKERGKEWDCLGVQLEFMWYEMTETSEGRYYQGETLTIGLPDALNGADMPNRSRYYPNGKPTPDGAARMFHNYFERSNEAAGEHLGRGGRAEKIFEELTGKSGSVGSSGNPACEKKKDSKFGNGIVEAAIELGRWGEEFQACYDYGGGHSDQVDLERRIDNHFHGLGENGVDCSGFVSAAILKGTGEFFVGSTQAFCDSDKFEKIAYDKAEPGDLSVECGSHIEVITDVKGVGDFDTVGSHTTGCGPGFGPSPSTPGYKGNGQFVLRFKGGGKK